MPEQSKRSARRHDRRPTEGQRDQRVKLDVDPEDALRHLLGVKVDEPDEDETTADDGPCG